MPTSVPDRHVARLRALRRGSRPTVSVILVVRSEAERARAAIESILPQCTRVAAELVVVTRSPSELAAACRSNPAIRLVGAPAESTVAHMRVLGAAECAGDIIGFTDDSAPIAADWINALTADPQASSDGGSAATTTAVVDSASAQ